MEKKKKKISSPEFLNIFLFYIYIIRPVRGDKRPGSRSSCAPTYYYYITRFLAGKMPRLEHAQPPHLFRRLTVGAVRKQKKKENKNKQANTTKTSGDEIQFKMKKLTLSTYLITIAATGSAQCAF